MSKTEFLRALEQVLGVEAESLHGAEQLDSLEQWDSLAMLSFMAMAEEKAGTRLPAGQISACSSVEDLFLLIKK